MHCVISYFANIIIIIPKKSSTFCHQFSASFKCDICIPNCKHTIYPIHSASISLNFHLDLHMWILSEPYTSPNIPQWFLSFLCSNNAVIQLIHYLYSPFVTSLQTGSWLPHFCHSSFACHTILGFVGIGYTIWCLLTLSILSMYRLR